ncbi:MAG: BCCT family transporter [Firmicutes bacterium]|nr:BCCT family transporter [Bacillota bacterium]
MNSLQTSGQPEPAGKTIHDLNKGVFWPALIVIGLIVSLLLLFPSQGNLTINATLHWIEYRLDWFFEIGNFGFLLFGLYMAFGKYGKVKMGDPLSKPEFSTLSWAAMLFCTGIGSSLIYWGVCEPLSYWGWPPFGLEAYSLEAADWGVPYVMFHWGIMGWVPAVIPGLAVGFAYHNRSNGSLAISQACVPLIGQARANGLLGKIIDILVIFGIMGAAATSLGIGVPQLTEAISQLFHVPVTSFMQIMVLLIWVCIFGFSVYSGLYKGIKKLSDINVYLAFFLLAAVIVLGPTAFILSNMTNGFGLMLQNFVRMCFYTDAIGGSGFPQEWTVFFYAWWICYGPLIGIFLARVSKGRTFREVVLCCILFASLGCWLVTGIFGSYAVNLQTTGAVDLLGIYAEQGGAAAMVATITSLPGAEFFLVVFIVLQFIFMATTLDSAAFVMACNCTKNLKGEEQPNRNLRVIWACMLGALGLGVLLIGTLKAVQSTSIIGSVPIFLVWIVLICSLLRWLKSTYGSGPIDVNKPAPRDEDAA